MTVCITVFMSITADVCTYRFLGYQFGATAVHSRAAERIYGPRVGTKVK